MSMEHVHCFLEKLFDDALQGHVNAPTLQSVSGLLSSQPALALRPIRTRSGVYIEQFIW